MAEKTHNWIARYAGGLYIAFAIFATVPLAVNILVGGRGHAEGSGALGSVAETPMGGNVRIFMLFILLVLAALVLISWLHRGVRIRTESLVLFLIWGALMTCLSLTSVGVRGALALAPAYLCVLVVLFVAPASRFSVGKLLGHLSGATAIASLLWGFLQPATGMMVDWAYGDQKRIIDFGLLAGPFTHSNILGMALAIGAPWIFLIRQKMTKVVYSLAVLFALLLTASRTAILAVSVSLIFIIIVRLFRTPRARRFYTSGVFAVLIITGLLWPFLEDSASALQGRGQIWQASIDAWKMSPLIGNTSDVFVTGRVSEIMGYSTSHAHNIYLTAGAAGGLLGISVLLLIVFIICHYSKSLVGATLIPAASVINLLLMGIVEQPFSLTNIIQHSAFGWLSILAILQLGIWNKRVSVCDSAKSMEHSG